MGVLPGFGRQEPNDWGLGLELRDHKFPHWTGSHNSERTFGHFGRSGTFLWVDPEPGIALACLTDLEFGEWATEGLAGAVGRGARRAQSLNSGRISSSNVSLSQLATTDGVSARTDAVRGTSIASATSPK